MIVSIIVAMGNNRVIGFNNQLPWKLPADMVHFRQKTLGKPVIMGQRTFESIGRSLLGRANIILTTDHSFKQDGCIVSYSIEDALKAAEETGAEEVMIAGGVSIYNQFLPRADRIYLTEIEEDFAGDAYFPEFDLKEWNEVERVRNAADQNNSHNYSFVTLERKK